MLGMRFALALALGVSVVATIGIVGATSTPKQPTSQPATRAPAAAGAGTAAPLAALKEKYRRPPTIPFPDDNLFTAEKAQLGRTLFFDPRLSGSNLLSCASCHNPSFGWGDGQPRATGHGMAVLDRRTPTILNSAWGASFFWDGRALTLEAQALGPIGAEGEMNQPIEDLPGKLVKIPGYSALFERAFPGQKITLDTIAKAIATFERSVVSGVAPFDRWIEGDEAAITDGAKRGFVLFNGKANCAACHGGWNFSDETFHDIGVKTADIGRAKLIEDLLPMLHAFKTPGLRDTVRRAPYMHNGSIATLEEVIVHYEQGFVRRPSLSAEMKAFTLTKDERQDLLAFLETLTAPAQTFPAPMLPR